MAPTRVSWLRVILGVVVAVELSLIVGSFQLLSDAGHAYRTPLEQRPLARTGNVVVKRADILDSLSVMSGSQVLGRDPLAAEDLGVPSFRSQLVYDSGHFSWIVLHEPVEGDAPLLALATSGNGGEGRRQALTDGVLNFFYDLGGDPRTFIHNWSTVGVQELQMSPLLPWTKKIDFVVVSAYDPAHCGALSYLLEGNPDLLLLGPPLPATPDPQWGEAGVRTLAVARGARGLRALAAGLHPLTPRLWVWVYPVSGGRCEAALVIRRGARLTVVAGAAGLSPPQVVAQVEAAGLTPVTGYIGATGYEMDDDEARASLDGLRRSHADIHVAPGYATSIEGLVMLGDVLGSSHVEPARLGARISLSRF